MASTNATFRGDFDERLAEALQGALIDGEEVIAQEVGDQGQAIVLTGSRIIILKVGLAATGELNGQKASAYPLDSVTAINLRKGPLGAVIQVCADDAQSPAQNAKPDHVVVFTGPGRVKKAEAFAAAIESEAGKPVNRIAPRSRVEQPADKPVVEEVISTEPVAQAQEAVEVVPIIEAAELESEDEEEEELVVLASVNPNPNLPKPVRKSVSGPNGLLVALGVLAVLVFVGMAVMAPLREVQTVPAPIIGTTGSLVTQRSIRLQLAAVTNYHGEVSKVMAKANAEASALRSAVGSGSQSAVQNACRPGRIDDAWQKISAMSPPSGLAEANENLLNGLMMMRNAAAAASAASATVDSKETLSRFDEADALVREGQAAIAAQRASLAKQAAKPAKPGK